MFLDAYLYSSKRERKDVNLDGREGEDMGGVGGRGTIIRIYGLKNIFNKNMLKTGFEY